jgi:hypothetical protein
MTWQNCRQSGPAWFSAIFAPDVAAIEPMGAITKARRGAKSIGARRSKRDAISRMRPRALGVDPAEFLRDPARKARRKFAVIIKFE